VVLREGQALTERELRDFAATKLADFKVPAKCCSWPKFPKALPASCNALAWLPSWV
jgi:hypothetical protein